MIKHKEIKEQIESYIELLSNCVESHNNIVSKKVELTPNELVKFHKHIWKELLDINSTLNIIYSETLDVKCNLWDAVSFLKSTKRSLLFQESQIYSTLKEHAHLLLS